MINTRLDEIAGAHRHREPLLVAEVLVCVYVYVYIYIYIYRFRCIYVFKARTYRHCEPLACKSASVKAIASNVGCFFTC